MHYKEEDNTTNILHLEKLFKEHYRSLCNVAFNIVNDRAAAEDVVQEVFLKVWKGRKKLQINATLKGYLYKSTVNTALNVLEKNNRSMPVENDKITELLGAQGKTQDSLVQQELEQLIADTINDLPDKCKQVFMMSRFEQLKYAEIAETLGISIKTVENQMGKALSRIRGVLKEYLPNYSTKSQPRRQSKG